MCKIAKPNSFIVISVASTGRIEHGTERSGKWQSPGNKDNYYLNLIHYIYFLTNYYLIY